MCVYSNALKEVKFLFQLKDKGWCCRVNVSDLYEENLYDGIRWHLYIEETKQVLFHHKDWLCRFNVLDLYYENPDAAMIGHLYIEETMQSQSLCWNRNCLLNSFYFNIKTDFAGLMSYLYYENPYTSIRWHLYIEETKQVLFQHKNRLCRHRECDLYYENPDAGIRWYLYIEETKHILLYNLECIADESSPSLYLDQ